MRFFIDTEFIESGPMKPIQLISIGIATEAGNDFYAVNADFRESDANDWVRANVLPHLLPPVHRWPLNIMRERILAFIEKERKGEAPEFWGYYSDYDWVVFCQIFGTMMDLPNGFPMYCRDLKQWADQLDIQTLPAQSTIEHDALNDARWNRNTFWFLQEGAMIGSGWREDELGRIGHSLYQQIQFVTQKYLPKRLSVAEHNKLCQWSDEVGGIIKNHTEGFDRIIEDMQKQLTDVVALLPPRPIIIKKDGKLVENAQD